MPATEPQPLQDTDLVEHQAYLYRYALAHLRDATLADEAVQDTMVAALRSRDSFAGRSSVRTWLTAILKNKITDLRYLQNKDAARVQSLQDESESDAPENDARDYDSLFDQAGAWQSPPQSWPSPESAWEQSEFWAVFESCLDKLPANTARAFTMREVMGCDTDEVCEELKITEANCWVMLYRARMSLKLCLERKWFGGKSQRG